MGSALLFPCLACSVNSSIHNEGQILHLSSSKKIDVMIIDVGEEDLPPNSPSNEELVEVLTYDVAHYNKKKREKRKSDRLNHKYILNEHFQPSQV